MIYIETIIIGAGPAGIQTGYFLDKIHREYLIIEGNSNPGSFFNHYPISRTLISLNKKYTGHTHAELKLKYDWNSLLNDQNCLFTDYSDELYPHADSLLKYLLDFSEKMNIKIQYNSPVIKICKVENTYHIKLADSTYTCKYLIVATGLKSKIATNFKTYADMTHVTFEKFNDKRVCIVGSGNSAYELANLLSNRSRYTIMIQKNVNLSLLTHYPGDVRANYLYFLDLFSLKAQNAILSPKKLVDTDSFIKSNNEYSLVNFPDPIKKYTFDEVVFCRGFEFDDSIFDFNIQRNGKYPAVKHTYESINNQNLFFVGTLMHSLDCKISAGGFIHGFRYLIKFFVESLYDKHILLKFTTNLSLATHIYDRFNKSSSLYLMFNFMCDVVVIENGEFLYTEGLTLEAIKNLKVSHMVIQLRTKKFNSIDEFFTQGQNYNIDSKFLHPYIKIVAKNSKIDEEIMFHEDTLAMFDDLKVFHKVLATVDKFSVN